MADQEHLYLLRQGTPTWNEWRRQHPEVQPDLKEADLSGADLSGADLSGADLSGAKLWKANLTGADLKKAILWKAYLGRAELSGAYLNEGSLPHENPFREGSSHQSPHQRSRLERSFSQ